MMVNRITDEEIRLRSYFIWEREGRPLGRSWDHWFRAKAELSAERPIPITTPVQRQPDGGGAKAAMPASPVDPKKKPRSRKA